MSRLALWLALAVVIAGCVRAPSGSDPLKPLDSDEGLVVWEQEYVFRPPPSPWRLLDLDEEDYSIAFFRACGKGLPGVYPCESTMAYDEEPFGFSRSLPERQQEFFRRFLWAARIDFEPPSRRFTTLFGEQALDVETVGHERVLGHKVLVRAIFARRGERIVAFYFTQWRSSGEPFDRTELEDFDGLVRSFDFRRPSFYQRLKAQQAESPK